jgi:hypothetical protein
LAKFFWGGYLGLSENLYITIYRTIPAPPHPPTCASMHENLITKRNWWTKV